MNRIIKSSLLLIAIFFSLSACGDSGNISFEKEVVLDTKDMNVDGCGDIGPFTVSYNFDDYLTFEDTPNIEKAKVSLLFSANINLYTKVKIDDSAFSPSKLDGYYDLFTYFGFTDIDEKLIKFNTDSTDLSKIQIGHRFAKRGGKKYDVIFCAIIDSGILDGWESNFHIGYDDQSYYEKTGEHPEWTEKDNHKGFDVTANRCVTTIEQYLLSKKERKTQQILYIFGHSRGGAVSNLVAKKMIDKGYETCAYAAAAPQTTTSSDYSNPKYNHIFNYVNDVDAICNMPPKELAFKRFGQEIHFDVRNYKESFKTYVGIDLPEISDTNPISRILSASCSKREDLYKLDENLIITQPKTLADQEAADEYIQEQKDKFRGSFKSLQGLIGFKQTTTSGNKISVTVITCPAMVAHLLGCGIAAYGLSASAFTTIFVQYYSVVSAFTSLAGYSSPIQVRDEFDTQSFMFCHFYQSYVAYYCA